MSTDKDHTHVLTNFFLTVTPGAVYHVPATAPCPPCAYCGSKMPASEETGKCRTCGGRRDA